MKTDTEEFLNRLKDLLGEFNMIIESTHSDDVQVRTADYEDVVVFYPNVNVFTLTEALGK